MHGSLTRYAWLSIAAAIVTITLKGTAYLLSNSVGLLADALESFVNLATAIVALFALIVAARPPDREHAYGHGKVEYLSSGFEGVFILVAAASIAVTAIERLLRPQPVEQVGLGLAISSVASVVNLVVARVLAREGRQHRSITLEVDARHLMTDVWTSAGILVGVAAVAITHIAWLDAAIALLVAANIAREGVSIVRRSVLGILDTALPNLELAAVEAILKRHEAAGIQFHALRTRQAGARNFVSVHVLVPGEWTVQKSHDLGEAIARDITAAVPNVTVTTHLEPLADPTSWQDAALSPLQETDDEA